MRRIVSREFLAAFVPSLLITLAAFWFTLRYVKPAPPDSFVISAATKGSPYYDLAVEFQKRILKSGVKVEVRESQGSFDNMKALQDPSSGV